MNSYSKTQIYISIALFITINVLFYFKYLYRVSPIVGLVSGLLYLFFSYFLFDRYYKGKLQITNKIIFPLITGFVICCPIVLTFIPKESLNVDRWEMIEVFWNAVREGIYPYVAQGHTGNYPGPMPFYFILSYPFYLIGEIGYITILGVLLWLYYIYKYEEKALSLTVFLLFSSLAIYWEIFARSTIFFNSCLFAFFLFALKDVKNKSDRYFYLSALTGGLLTSTRNVFGIVLIIWLIYALMQYKISFPRLFKWGLCFLGSFILSFIPFVLIDLSGFVKMNPFIVQSSFLMPFLMVIFFLVLSFVFGFFCKRFSDVIFYSGLLLFLTITGHVIYAISSAGVDAYLTAGADISYYIFCFPFLLKVITGKDD